MAKIKSLKSPALREHNFICAFILSERFCSLFYHVFRPIYFQNADYKTLLTFIQTYFEKYNRPPRKMVLSYIERHKNKFVNNDMYESIKKTLVNASETMDDLLEKYDSQFIIDDAESFIKSAELRMSAENILNYLDGEDEEGALKTYSDMKLPEITKRRTIVFENSTDILQKNLADNTGFLVKFKTQIGDLLGPFYRGDFFFWLAGTGIGKTWFLQWTAKQCRDVGLNVFFISLEMTEADMLKRFSQMYYRVSLYGEDVAIPKFIQQDDSDMYKMTYRSAKSTKLTAENIKELRSKKIAKFPQGKLYISCGTALTINDIHSMLNGLKYENSFIPDVICIDYADKMETSKRIYSERDKLGTIWKDLRDLALSKNILVVTASQTNRSAWGKHFDSDSIADDSRKLNESTAAVGVMADKDELQLGLFMLKLLKVRGNWHEHRNLYCSMNLHIGQPVIDTVWANKLEKPTEPPEENKYFARSKEEKAIEDKTKKSKTATAKKGYRFRGVNKRIIKK